MKVKEVYRQCDDIKQVQNRLQVMIQQQESGSIEEQCLLQAMSYLSSYSGLLQDIIENTEIKLA